MDFGRGSLVIIVMIIVLLLVWAISSFLVKKGGVVGMSMESISAPLDGFEDKKKEEPKLPEGFASLKEMLSPSDPKGREGFSSLEKKAKEGFASLKKALGSKEGFGGVARGAGSPDCMRTLADAAAVYQAIADKVSESKDLAEFRLLLSKWGCLKKDLMGIQGVVEATRYQPYSTLHDRIPVADIAAQCKAKTIPQRDLDISLQTWRERAVFLLRRLAEAASMSSSEADALEKRLGNAWADLYDVSKSQCLSTIPSGGLQAPRDAVGYSPDLANVGPYSGLF